jgi:16S rRNA (guanine966-N2)-methyltransferase
VRVVGGSAGGLRLKAPPGLDTRPTTDRVRAAIFSSLESAGAVAGARVLDLFAGSGALGIEALSRGAAAATFVDARREAIGAVEANLASTGLAGGTAVRGDAVRFVSAAEAGGRYDLAFADPPYDFDGWDDLLAVPFADLVVLESDRPLDVRAGWEVLRARRYGGTVVTMARAAS